jgi:hypothetical protein
MFSWIRSFQLVVSLAVLALLLVLGGCVSGVGELIQVQSNYKGLERPFPIRSIRSGSANYGKLHTT